MQPRKHGELKPRSPASKLRDDRADWRPEHYIRRDDRSPPLRLRRSSLSPPKYERALRIVGREGRSRSRERREYGWELVGGLRTRVRSRSPPPVGHGRKRAHFDDAVFGRNGSPIEMREKYHLMDHLEQADLFDDAKHVYGYEHGNPRMVKERDYAGPVLAEKSMILEDGQVREVLRPPQDIIGPNSNYDEIGGNLGIPAKLDIDRLKEDSCRFGHNQLSTDKLPLVESLKEREKHMVFSRDIPYSAVPVSHFKDLGSTSHLKEFAGTSSGIPRAERIGPFRELRDGLRLPPDEYVNNYGKYADSADYNGNEHELQFNTRGIDVERRALTFQHQRALGPDMADHLDYLYRKHGQNIDDQGFPYDYSYRKLPSPARGDLAYGESVRQLDEFNDVDGPNMVMIRSLRDHPSLQKQINEDYIDVGRISSTLKQVGAYSAFKSGHADLDRRFSQDDDIINSRVMNDQEISSARLDYEFARHGPGPNKDRLMKSSTSVYDAEKHRFILSQQRMRERRSLAFMSHLKGFLEGSTSWMRKLAKIIVEVHCQVD
ncbi:hypothetical protein RJ641_005299 [Dillenia turbinata]|uniref:Uncharacterized protein n=1 Tax=Dillenia turbinata TaxID=194707 RepID=A0AAN8V923_9MAGN